MVADWRKQVKIEQNQLWESLVLQGIFLYNYSMLSDILPLAVLEKECNRMWRRKKSMVWIILPFALTAVFCLWFDFNVYESRSKTISCEDDGIIFSITTFNGDSETTPFLKCLGHTWLSIDNQSGHSVYIKDHEIKHDEKSLSVNIGEPQLKIIEAYIDQKDKWSLGKNCSYWSVRLWNEVVDEAFELKTQTLFYTPKRLERSFCEFDCVEADKDFSRAGHIFCYRDGVRTELELCSRTS